MHFNGSGTAISGVDYTGAALSVTETIVAGTTGINFALTGIDDSVIE